MAFSYSKQHAARSIELTPEDAADAGRLLALILGSRFEKSDKGERCANARAALAKRIHDSRRARDKFFPAEVFSDPAWDILLILYWAHHAQQRLSVSGVCASAAVPATTALRWIENLSSLGFLRKQKHQTDRRVTWLDLSKDAQEKLDQYLDGVLNNLEAVFDNRASPEPRTAQAALQAGDHKLAVE